MDGSADSRPKVTWAAECAGATSNAGDLLAALSQQVDPGEDPRNIVSEEAQRKKLANDLQVYERQVEMMKAMVGNLGEVASGKEAALSNVRAGVRALKDAGTALDGLASQLRRQRHLSSEEELAPLRRQLEDDAYNVERLRQLVASCKADVDGTTSAIAALKERTADELNALRVNYVGEAEKGEQRLKEARRAHEQARLEKERWKEHRREQVRRLEDVNDEAEALKRDFQKLADERARIHREQQQLEADDLKLRSAHNFDALEQRCQQNKRDAALHAEQHAAIQVRRSELRKVMSEEKTRKCRLTRDLTEAEQEHESLEKRHQELMLETHHLIDACLEKRELRDRVIAQTADHEREMLRKLEEAKENISREYAAMGARLSATRRSSCALLRSAEEETERARAELERRRAALNEELQVLNGCLEAARAAAEHESASAGRFYARVEHELDQSCRSIGQGIGVDLELMEARVQRLAVRTNRELPFMHARLDELRAKHELRSRELTLLLKLADAEAAVKVVDERDQKLQALVKELELETASLSGTLTRRSRLEHELRQQLKQLGVVPSEFALPVDQDADESDANASGADAEADDLKTALQQRVAQIQQSVKQLGWSDA